MEPANETHISEFLLLGFSEGTESQPFLLGLFLSMYLVTVCGNLLIILATVTDDHLHTPMYFFLSNLSFVDICLSSTTVPKMLVNIHMQRRVITYGGCLTQMHFFIHFASLDDFLLAVMAYDRFMAISHPLHYTVTMNPWLCVLLVLGSWTISALYALFQTSLALQLSFCAHLEIPHFFCEYNQTVQRSCFDTFVNDIVVYFAIALLAGGPFIGIIFSYYKIVSSICLISSALGKYKAFSTCVSHLSVFFQFYSTCLGVYMDSFAAHNAHASAPASVMYTIVTPMLNPFIYSLRNEDLKKALRRSLFGKPYNVPWPRVIRHAMKCSTQRLKGINYESLNCKKSDLLQSQL